MTEAELGRDLGILPAMAPAAENVDRFDDESEGLLAEARADAETFRVPVETRTVISHRVVADLSRDPQCDLLVLDPREFDPSAVLVPTAGGGSSTLSAEVAAAFRDVLGSEVSLLHVVDDESALETGREFLSEWAAAHDLTDAEVLVEAGDVESSIARRAADHSLVVVGATERGVLARIAGGSLAFDDDALDASVVLAEGPSERSVRERLFGRR